MAGDGSAVNRQNELALLFRQKYGQEVEFFARAPGRVNLIGEHIDYHGYSVLPMALTNDILMAVSRNKSNEIHVASTENEKYADFMCSTTECAIDKRNPQWYSYLLCGVKACEEALPEGVKLQGMNVLVDGCIPPNAGLSSSSALVCCAALAAFQACHQKITRNDLATRCAQAERYIGTEGGGMDQAISLLAQAGKAKLIDFDPLRSTDVALPKEAVFVVANCCVELNKAATSHFNTRVAEGRVGVALIAKLKNLNWRELKKAKALQETLNLSLAEMSALVDSTFHDAPYTLAEAAKALEISEANFKSAFLSHVTENLAIFHLKPRLRHVFSEAARVASFQSVCVPGKPDANNALVELGNLMYESHVSCRDDYACSCDQLDELVEVMMKAGARGARLTGAGWGGCAVALVERGKEEDFVRDVKEGFYGGLKSDQENGAVFVTTPGAGGEILANDEVSVLL